MSMIKVNFSIEQDDDGFPGIASESVWASPGIELNEFVIDNTPFFAREATVGDLVEARQSDGNFCFVRIVKSSHNSLVRAVFFDASKLELLRSAISDLGCQTEYLESHHMLAISVPREVAIHAVRGVLEGLADEGVLDYEEAILRGDH